MHELSIAQNIVEIVEQYVPVDKRSHVYSVSLKIGDLSGIVADSLEFCFNAIIADTPLRDATLRIERTPFSLECDSCRKEFTNESGIILCPTCGGSNTKIISGTELQVMHIELTDELVEQP